MVVVRNSRGRNRAARKRKRSARRRRLIALREQVEREAAVRSLSRLQEPEDPEAAAVEALQKAITFTFDGLFSESADAQ